MRPILLPLLGFLLISCVQTPQSTGLLQAHFCPASNCSEVLLSLLNSSTTSQCAFYTLDDERLLEVLREKDTELIFDEEETLPGKKRFGSGLMHNKFCVLNRSTVVSGSFNPSSDDYNNLLVIESKPIVEFYERLFKNLFKRTPSKHNQFIHNGKLLEIYACPQDNCQTQVLRTLSMANTSVTFALFTFTDKDVTSLLIDKLQNNVSIVGVVESFQQKNLNQFYPLEEAGADVVLEETNRLQHNKVFVIDRQIVITGSYNPTKAAYTINDENILIIHDAELAAFYENMILSIIEKVY